MGSCQGRPWFAAAMVQLQAPGTCLHIIMGWDTFMSGQMGWDISAKVTSAGMAYEDAAVMPMSCDRRQGRILKGAKIMHSHIAHTIFRLQHWSRFRADYVQVFGYSPPRSSTRNLALSEPDRLGPTCHYRQRRSFPCL